MQSSLWLDLLLLLSLPMAAGNDLLDLVSVDRYWQEAKTPVTVDTMIRELRLDPPPDVSPLIRQLGDDEFRRREEAMTRLKAHGAVIVDALESAASSPDPEVADRVRQLLKQIGPERRAVAERRLMAIRMLAELRQTSALPALKRLLKRREPFVAEYAQAAIAAIEGRPFHRPQPSAADLEQDLAAVPADAALVGQIALRKAVPFRFDTEVNKQSTFLGQGYPRVRLYYVYRSLGQLTQRITNLRLDAVTIARSAPTDPATAREEASPWQLLVARGLCDPVAVREALVEAGGVLSRQGEVEVLSLAEHSLHVAILSPQRLVIASGPTHERTRVVAAAVSALASNRRQLAADSPLGKLVEKADRRAPAWLATTVSEVQRRDPLWGSIESYTANAQHEDKGLSVSVSVHWLDKSSRAAAALAWTTQIREWQRQHARFVDRGDAQRQPLVDLLKSAKVESTDDDDATAKITDLDAFLSVPLSLLVRSEF